MNYLITFYVILHIFITQSYSQICTQRNVCECVFDDGSGYNLKLVVENDSFLEAKSDNATFFFHPCGDTKSLPNINSTIENPCQHGYILCMYNQTDNKMEVLGHEATMEFRMNLEAMEIIFVDPQSADPKYSVSLECVPNSKNNVLYAPLDINHDQVRLALYSKLSCRTPIDKIVHQGFFHTFFILFSFSFLVLIIGVLINYYYRQRKIVENMEIIE